MRFQQTLEGLPVLGAQLVTTVGRGCCRSPVRRRRGSSRHLRAYGRAMLPGPPAVVTARAHDLPLRTLRADRPGRWLYDASLLQPGGDPGAGRCGGSR